MKEEEYLYQGKINSERISEYQKLAELYNIDESTIGRIYCAGAEWGATKGSNKTLEDVEKIMDSIGFQDPAAGAYYDELKAKIKSLKERRRIKKNTL